ncbi:MAG: signal peptide peptidase SppA [Deltaproteobacteria bacterium]|nr:signal peptide peptidase SppA [Deltaproteobacteria bacterium]
MLARRSPFTLMVAGAFILGLTLATSSCIDVDHYLGFGEKVGVVEIKGLLSEARPVLEELRRFQHDRRIKAIVLRVNSPGGAVTPAQEIMREVEKVRGAKKVVASFGSMAASGGYYAACSADLIIASPGTSTGSIGVILRLPNLEQLAKKLGVDVQTLQAGALKDIGSPFHPMTPEERAALQKLLDNIHRQFIRDVARHRKLPEDKVKALADGNVLTGEEAKHLGLVDELGNYQDAVERAGRLGGIKGKVETVTPEKKGISLLRLLLGLDAEKTLRDLTILAPEPALLPPWYR